MEVRAASAAAMTLGSFADMAGRMSSTTGLAVSSSIKSRSASIEEALVAGRVEMRPFSTIGEMT